LPDFAYVARDMTGKSMAGTIAAANARDAASQLGARSLFPISITVNKGSQVKLTRRVAGGQMASFYTQLSSLLRSGVPMLRSLTVLSNQSGASRTLRNAIS
jgi:type II secretory pathway component PulF